MFSIVMWSCIIIFILFWSLWGFIMHPHAHIWQLIEWSWSQKMLMNPKVIDSWNLNIHYSNLMNMVSCKASCACNFMTCLQWIRHLTRRCCYHVVWRKLMPCLYVILNDLLLMEGYGRNTIRFINNHKIHDNKNGKSTLCSYSPMQLIVVLITI
jgi:hypothetical protein